MQHPMQTRGILSRLAVTLGLCLVVAVGAARGADEEKQTVQQKAMKARSTEPKDADIDKSVTLDTMLAKKGANDLSAARAATIEGKIVQVEKETDDGDIHVVLAPAGGETDTTKWVIVEVTPAWEKKKPALAKANVDKLRGKTVRVTGWLFYEPEDPHPDPRGTRWELHPVTEISAAK